MCKNRGCQGYLYFLPTFMLSKLCAWMCCKHFMHQYESTPLSPPSVLVNAQVYKQQLRKCPGRVINVCHIKFCLSYAKPKITLLHKEGIWGRKATGSLPEVMRTQGRLWPLILPTAHLPSSNLDFWVLVWEQCVQADAFQEMRQATGEASLIIPHMLLFYQVPLLAHSALFPA